MDGNPSASQPRRYFRFSLGMLLVLITCICCFLAGRNRGYEEAMAKLLPQLRVSTKAYYVGDFTVTSSQGTPQIDFRGLTAKIEQQCSPDTWLNKGGPGRIAPFSLNSTLIINANEVVHDQIETLLAKLRREKFGPNYQPNPPLRSRTSVANSK